MAYSKGQLEAIWEAANPGDGDPHLMAAIALAESSGSASSINSIGACGLWQIHPYEAGCTSPMLNAKMAGEKLRSQGLNAWEAYTNGAYKQYYTGVANTGRKNIGILEDIAPGLGGPVEKLFGEGKLTSPGETLGELGENPLGASPEIGGTGGVLGGLSGLNKFFELITSKEGWIRIGKVGLGVILLLVGILGMADFQPSVPSSGVPVKKIAESAGVAAAI